MTDPIYVYNHTTGTPTGSAITGGTFYKSDDGAVSGGLRRDVLFRDYVSGFIRYLDPASPGSSVAFLTGASSPVDLQVGPDGDLYYLARGGTQGVYRITYTAVINQEIIVSTDKLTVNEGSTATFNVRLAKNPGAAMAVRRDQHAGPGLRHGISQPREFQHRQLERRSGGHRIRARRRRRRRQRGDADAHVGVADPEERGGDSRGHHSRSDGQSSGFPDLSSAKTGIPSRE